MKCIMVESMQDTSVARTAMGPLRFRRMQGGGMQTANLLGGRYGTVFTANIWDLVGEGRIGMVVRVALQAEDDAVGEEPVAVPGVLNVRPLVPACNRSILA